jgi:hypothetical protein
MRTSPELENLVKVGSLKREKFSQAEFDGLVRSGAARIADARNHSLALESLIQTGASSLSHTGGATRQNTKVTWMSKSNWWRTSSASPSSC